MSAAGALLLYAGLCLMPVAFFGVVAAALSPERNRVKRVGGWMVDRVSGRPPRAGGGEQDPFRVLAVQVRLERVAREVADLEDHPRSQAARGHHLRAALRAYDDLLDEACRLAGLPDPDDTGVVARRMRREAQLRARGWCW